MPPGDLSKAPKPPMFSSGWALGPPDLIVKLPRAVTVPAEARISTATSSSPSTCPEDRWIRAIEFQPTARARRPPRALLHSPTGAAVRDDEAIPGLGGSARGLRSRPGRRRGRGAGAGRRPRRWGGLGGWVPGITPRFFPDGIAQPFPKRSNLVAQLHLHPSGKAETEQGSLAIYFAKTPPAKSLTGVQVPPAFGFAMGIDIPAGETAYTIRDSFVLPVDVEAFGARAHAHYLARRDDDDATLPDGRTQGLLKINDWDFGWQDSYFFKSPDPAAERHDDRRHDRLRQLSRQPEQPALAAQTRAVGPRSFDEMGSMTLLVGDAVGQHRSADAARGADAALPRAAPEKTPLTSQIKSFATEHGGHGESRVRTP